jgi:hypothetical protein
MQRNVGARCNPDGSGCPAGVTGTPISLVTQGILTPAFVNSNATRTELQQNNAGNFSGRIEQTTLNARLRPNQQFGIMTYIDSGGDSYYHGFQSTLRKRFANGLQVALSYTLAKSIDNQSLDPVGSTSGGGLSTTNSRTPVDIRNWRNERAVSDFDRRHTFNSAWLYELPLGRGKRFAGTSSGVVNHIISGWSLNGIYSAYTGEPFTVQSGVRTSNNSHISRAALTGELPKAGFKEQAGTVGPVMFTRAERDQYFRIPDPGDSGIGRNMFRGPGYWNFDLGIQKLIMITERWRLQFRAESFNTLNHPSFETPTASSSGSNQITSARFGESCCQAVAPSSTQNIIQTGESGRVIQFALKLMF